MSIVPYQYPVYPAESMRNLPMTPDSVIFAVIVAAQALTQIAPQTIAISKAAAAAQELFATIDRDSRIDSLSEGGIRSEDCEGNIELRDVGFSYPARPDVQILKGLSLSIPANTTTAIVGASGSGKSTIFGLIERWFNPASGTITLDGTELSKYNIRWLRTRIRLVQQVGAPTLLAGAEAKQKCDRNQLSSTVPYSRMLSTALPVPVWPTCLRRRKRR